jgi:kynurenine 3-monooxygenase
MNSKITVMGAGLVGSLWALLLKQKGFDVEVFEKRSDIRKDSKTAGRSINLVMTSRGLHALKTAGLLEEALKLAVPVFGRMIHSKSGEQTYQPYGLETERNLSISRASLNQFLIQAAEKAGVRFHFEYDLEKIDFEKKTLHFKSHTPKTYERLFGTDGAGSVVRKQLAEVYPKEFQEKTEWLPADYKELFLPQSNQLEKKALHIWPRGSHMMMALANLDGSFTVTLYLPKTGPVSFEKIKSAQSIESFFQSEFPDAVTLMPDYISDFQKNPQGALGTVRGSKWVLNDSVCLLGDAAHAIVPFFGQGMNAGFEDCTHLLKIFDEEKNWGRAFEKFNNTQRANANAIADMAIENWIEMSEKVALPEFQLRKKVEAQLEKRFPEIFKSRYGMVTYTLIPYSLVQKAGHLQDEIFKDLCQGLHSIDQLSFDKAEALLKKNYVPFLLQNNMSLRNEDFKLG